MMMGEVVGRDRMGTAMALDVVVVIVAATWYWRAQPRRSRRSLAVSGVAGVCISAGLSRINVYEMMFHPMGRPSLVAIGETNLAGDEKVLAVQQAGVARAYPIRSISYHHIVNDVLGGVPIVATY